MIARLSRRVAKLEGPYRRGGECDGPPTFCFSTRQTMPDFLAGRPPGRPDTPAPPGAARCPRCGVPHVAEAVEVVVATRAEAKQALALLAGEEHGRCLPP